MQTTTTQTLSLVEAENIKEALLASASRSPMDPELLAASLIEAFRAVEAASCSATSSAR
jgi:hypothetical protein